MAVAAYSVSLAKRPLATEMTTSGALWCLGDVVTQSMEQRDNNKNNQSAMVASSQQQQQQHDWDGRRTLSQTLYAALVWGPAAHMWYHGLEAACQRWLPLQKNGYKPWHRVATKVALEVVVLHPVALLAYFSVVGTLQGESRATIARQLQRDYVPTLLLEVVLWAPIDVLNFAFVPVRHQLLLANSACLLESMALSYIKNNGISMPFLASRDNNEKNNHKEQ